MNAPFAIRTTPGQKTCPRGPSTNVASRLTGFSRTPPHDEHPRNGNSRPFYVTATNGLNRESRHSSERLPACHLTRGVRRLKAILTIGTICENGIWPIDIPLFSSRIIPDWPSLDNATEVKFKSGSASGWEHRNLAQFLTVQIGSGAGNVLSAILAPCDCLIINEHAPFAAINPDVPLALDVGFPPKTSLI